jgi:hypothetical protein
MHCKIDHDDDLSIPQFLCVACNPGRIGSNGGPRLVAQWVDPIEARQRELRAAQAATVKAKRQATLAKHLQKIEDEHPGEEWDRKNKMWKRTDRSMAKYEAKLQAELEAHGKEAA